MDVIKTAIDGVLIIEPKVFGDKRGYFFESFSQREFDEKVAPILGHRIIFVQDNESMSSYGVMRGLHFQRPPFTQSKLVRCVKGAVLDVAVDQPYLWAACVGGTNRGKPSSILCAERLCSWICCVK